MKGVNIVDDETILIVLECKAESLFDVLSYKNKIDKFISSGEKIPARVLKKYFSYFTVQLERLAKEMDKKISIVREKTLNHFQKEEEFHFIGKKLIQRNEKPSVDLEKHFKVNLKEYGFTPQ